MRTGVTSRSTLTWGLDIVVESVFGVDLISGDVSTGLLPALVFPRVHLEDLHDTNIILLLYICNVPGLKPVQRREKDNSKLISNKLKN